MPDEVLGEILHVFVESESPGVFEWDRAKDYCFQRRKRLVISCGISRRLREGALGVPQLWSQVFVYDAGPSTWKLESNMFLVQLSRARKDAPIELVVAASYAYRIGSMINVPAADVIHALSPILSRCRTLCIYHGPAFFKTFLPLPPDLNHLENLWLKSFVPCGRKNHHIFRAPNATHLLRFRSPFEVNIYGMNPQRITYLKLRAVHGICGFSTFINTCSALTHLEMAIHPNDRNETESGFKFPPSLTYLKISISEFPPPSDFIRLAPNLKHLTVDVMSSMNNNIVSSSIVLPSLKTFRLESLCDPLAIGMFYEANPTCMALQVSSRIRWHDLLPLLSFPPAEKVSQVLKYGTKMLLPRLEWLQIDKNSGVFTESEWGVIAQILGYRPGLTIAVDKIAGESSILGRLGNQVVYVENCIPLCERFK